MPPRGGNCRVCRLAPPDLTAVTERRMAGEGATAIARDFSALTVRTVEYHFDNCAKLGANPHVRRDRPTPIPKGWEPGVEEHGDGTATAVSRALDEENPEHEKLIRGWNLDPTIWKIVGKVNCRRWQTYDERWLYYYKADLVTRDHDTVDLDELCKRVLRRKARAQKAEGGNQALVVNWADWQLGKDDGDGLKGTIGRLEDMFGKVEDRVRDLRVLGVPINGILVNAVGDLGEACGGHYAQQGFRTVLNVREQRKLVRHASDSAIDAWSRLVAWVKVYAVGGNHGEERQDGRSYTDFADNRDVAVYEDLAFAYSKNPDRYGNVSFHLPNDDLTLTYEYEGNIIGLAHGHQAGFTKGGDPALKIENWWSGQMKGQQPVGDADILITGHYHHLWLRTIGKRTHFGCPSLEGASDWFKNTMGVQSDPGTLTFVVGPNGWSRMEVL